jgi:hypothetical protein
MSLALKIETEHVLHNMLKEICKNGPHRSVDKRNSSVGITLEKLLGIPQNNSHFPDFKGIEIKSFLTKEEWKAKNPITLFNLVPSWDMSFFESSIAFYNFYSYESRNFYSTTYFKKENINKLFLDISLCGKYIYEKNSVCNEKFLSWETENINRIFSEKLKTTFFVLAERVTLAGREHFIYKNLVVAKNPSFEKFMSMLREKLISINHMILVGKAGRISERGPAFRVKPKHVFDFYRDVEKHQL